MKRVLGLDLGTNSIGWAVVRLNEKGEEETQCIELSGSRIIPMDAATLGDFDKGNVQSQAHERTNFRLVRRIRERSLLRRERMLKVLNTMGFLPEHFSQSIDFSNHSAKFKAHSEPKLAWVEIAPKTYEFLFRESFEEMLNDFRVHQPALVSEGRQVPYDWTIYYLRKKALSAKISKEELAWILLNFNQKRGYYQLRGEEDEEKANKDERYYALRVDRVEATDDRKGQDVWYNVYLENGWIYRRSSRVPLDWEGKIKEFIVTTDLAPDGTPKTDKDGQVKRSFRAPKEDEWKLLKKKTEFDIDQSGKTVGTYIYDTLLQNPNQKIKGKLVHTVERRFYKDELKAILRQQMAFHPELTDRALYEACLNVLYPQNKEYKNNISARDFVYLLVDDILFYQRPLKSKKSLIDNCPYESHEYVDRSSGEIHSVGVKCIAKSHPLFQEFRLWQFIDNIRLYEKEKTVDGRLQFDVDVTADFLKTPDDYVALFTWLNDRKEIKQATFLKYPPFGLKKNADRYRWNYVEDKAYPCNETRALMIHALTKAELPAEFLNQPAKLQSKGAHTASRTLPTVEHHLWHLLYSVEDKHELATALKRFASTYELNEQFVEVFLKFPPFKKEYGAYSAKAIKKLLPLMRRGSCWTVEAIDASTQERLHQLIAGELDEKWTQKAQSKITFGGIEQFSGLPLWQACYVSYGRHSEASEIKKWHSPEDLEAYIKGFKQHALRNPIVEQVILETLRVVRDLWRKVGWIDEIHVELGREMKNPADKRKQMTLRNLENENANLRIKALLAEFMNPQFAIENVRPYSPSQQEILRIYEDAALNGDEEVPDDILAILKKFKESDVKKHPTTSEVLRYKLWLEQKYRSPYTGEIIPLGKLFTTAYQIEHVIPQSRYFDDSFNNKVICESEVNKLKDNQLGYEFIKANAGRLVELSFGRTVKVLSAEAYESFVKDHYGKVPSKMRNLMMDEIPEKFIERQLNDTRYISKVVKSLLSNIVREELPDGTYEPEAISKNVIVCTGGVTDRLKRDWGVNDVWNSIVTPRFERMNDKLPNNQFGHWENADGKRYFQTAMPLEYQRGFNKKRIDHRHHAMDAIVIACANRNHVNYLNNESASAKAACSRNDLKHLLCEKQKTDAGGNYRWVVKKPWDTFTQEVRQSLSDIIVSFKQNLRVINKTKNYTEGFDPSTGKKTNREQVKGDSWAIRKPLHKETVYGRVNLRQQKEVRLSVALETPELIVDKKVKAQVRQLLSYGYDKKKIEKYFKENASLWKELSPAKVAVYYFSDQTNEPFVACRKVLDTSFNRKKIEESVTDTGIQKILLAHLEANENNPELAFSEDGIDAMNKNIVTLNKGKFHQPILKVRVYESLGLKFKVGYTGSKVDKYVESAKGTNLFFAVYQTKDGQRSYTTVPLNEVIERQKMGWSSINETNEKGDTLLFSLSPNDLVYVPTPEEQISGIDWSKIDKTRVYKMVSSTGNQCFFVPYFISTPIVNVLELGANNKAEKSWTGEMIKSVCVPFKINRLGEQ